MTAPLPSTLGRRLLRTVLLPLAFTWVAGSVVALAVAQYFSQQAFDRSLLNDAHLLAARVHADGGRLQLDLSPQEIRTILFDQTDKEYFSVRSADGTLIAGEADLAGKVDAGTTYRLYDITFAGQDLRAVTLRGGDAPLTFDVTVAQTTISRDEELRELMLYSLLPQIVLLVLLAAWLHRSIARDVQPLATLRRTLEDRGLGDLAPVPTQATTRDIQSLATAINALLQRLDRSIQAQREFAGNVAHELRTPLAGIRALASYGLAHAEPTVWREQLAGIAASEARATALVDRLLALALAAEAESRLLLAPIALDSAVRDAVLHFLHRADDAGVDLGARGIDSPVWVMAEPMLLEGILNNLIDNALRYGVSPAGGQPIITVAVEQREAEVALSVQDNGPGAPHDHLQRLAERGTQGEAGQLLGQGAGLGLALVAQYARLMNARMSLRAGPQGQGWVCEIVFSAFIPPRSDAT